MQLSHEEYMSMMMALEEESRTPNKVTAEQILKDAADLKAAKSKDYQGGMWSEADYFPYGHQSFIHMMWTKMLRIRNVVDKSDNDVNFESLEDSLLDMINYSAMYCAWVENQKMED